MYSSNPIFKRGNSGVFNSNNNNGNDNSNNGSRVAVWAGAGLLHNTWWGKLQGAFRICICNDINCIVCM